jgi:hypothetical protein
MARLNPGIGNWKQASNVTSIYVSDWVQAASFHDHTIGQLFQM